MEQTTVKPGDTVKVHCIGKLENGQVFTSSENDGPVEFKVGEFDLIKGLNDAVKGMKEGEERTVTLSPDQGFGRFEKDLVFGVSMDQLPENAFRGMQFKSEEDGRIWTIMDIDLEKQTALVDGNHVLAGQALIFDLNLLEHRAS